MKKFMFLITIVAVLVTLTACGSGSEEKSVTLHQMIKAYQDAGIEVNPEEKPMFQMVKANDGVIFYIDKDKVALYEYSSEKEASEAKEEYADIMKDWPQKGTLILESKNDQALQIFNSLE